MTDQEKKKKNDLIIFPPSEYEDFDNTLEDWVDAEYIEMLELLEKLKNGDITQDELKKLEYIRKTRENLVGGDA